MGIIFSGSKVKTPPFELTESNELIYNGDQTRNLVNINENRQIYINRPGSDIYTNVNRSMTMDLNQAKDSFKH